MEMTLNLYQIFRWCINENMDRMHVTFINGMTHAMFNELSWAERLEVFAVSSYGFGSYANCDDLKRKMINYVDD